MCSDPALCVCMNGDMWRITEKCVSLAEETSVLHL